MVRLNKYLSEAGVCSRREADRLIESGRVTVDGKRAVPGMKVEPGQEVRLGKKRIAHGQEKIVLAVNKPAGIVCTEDKREKKNIIRYLNYPVRVTYAGRLDKESEGLLIMTNDGDLINGMMRARYGHEKEYRVRVDRPITDAFVKEMEEGVRLVDSEKGMDVVTRPCKVEQVGKYTFTIILTAGIEFVKSEGCVGALGYQVERLVRTRIMNVELGSLKPGQVRQLTKTELEGLYERIKENQDAGTGRAAK